MSEAAKASPVEEGAAIADVLVPVAIDHSYSYLVPSDIHVARGRFCRSAARHPNGEWSRLGDAPRHGRRAKSEIHRGASRASAALRQCANLHRLGGALDLEPARHGVAHGDWRAIAGGAGTGADRRASCGPAAKPHDQSPRPRSRGSGRRACLPQGGARRDRRLFRHGVIDTLIDEGTLEAIALPPEPAAQLCDPAFARPLLEAAQQDAADSLVKRVKSRDFSVTLLEGVTGSGKTEVYFEAIAAALEAGRQSLILMPEIALTAQFLDRFAARFGARPAEWHSGVSARKRARLWSGVATGGVKVVAGARSALFLPFTDLATIVVDEEHEAAYKQEDGVAYHARDMAVVRGQIEKAAVILSSATPSIESRVNAAQGRYRPCEARHKRFNAKATAGYRGD